MMQKSILVQGEVVYPGHYAILSEDETLHEIIHRAGVLTKNAFTKGAVYQNNILLNVNLDKIVKGPDLKMFHGSC